MKKILEITQFLLWLLGATFFILSLLDLSDSGNIIILQLNEWFKLFNAKHPTKMYFATALILITSANTLVFINRKIFPKIPSQNL